MELPQIKKEYLYPEDSFISYCQRDQFQGVKLGKRVTSEFLRAAEKDGLIVPLLTEKVNKDGEESEVRYYSPFQIFLVAAIIENIIDDGELRAPDNIEWYKERGTRYIDWGGGHNFWADHYKEKKGGEPEPMEHNAFTIADDFHQLLRLIHSLDLEERYEFNYEKRRLHTGDPLLTYNLDSLKDGGAKYVEQYGLNLDRIKRVIVSIGYIATNRDPLEKWYHYVEKHPQVRKDQLKGMASLAQDLYGFCDIAYDIVNVVYGTQLPSLPDLLHPDFMPDRTEYAHGEDLRAVQAALSKLELWVEENKTIVAELGSQIEYEKVVGVLKQIRAQLGDFEQRYGDRRYVGFRRTYRSEDLNLEDLDERTRRMVESLTQQRIQYEEKESKTVSEEDKKQMIANEIPFSISSTLGDLARSVSGIAHQIADAMWTLHHEAERQKETVKVPAMEDFHKKVDRSDPDYARKNAEFWRTGLKEYEKQYQDRLDQIDSLQNELHSIGNLTRLVFCAACRKNLVQKHYIHFDGQITEEAVCDSCFEDEADKVMFGTDEDRKNTKYAEWYCDHCDQLLLKFAIGNVVAARTQNKTSMRVVLKYGHAQIEAHCPGCGNLNHRPLDWGWTS